MRLLVTGAHGFIGSHFCPEMVSRGHIVERIPQGADLRIPGMADILIEDTKPDAVVHLAALPGREFGEINPHETISRNVTMTVEVARACVKHDVILYYISTSEVTYVGKNLYGFTKLWGEQACNLYHSNGTVILRLFMPYGIGHPPGKGRAALTNFIWQAMNNQPIIVHKNTRRSWVWVGDLVRAMALLIERSSFDFPIWNIGRVDNEETMSAIAFRVCDIIGAPYSLIQEIETPVKITAEKRPDISPLLSLGWKPEVEIDEGIRRVYQWLDSQREAFGNAADNFPAATYLANR